MKRWPLAFLLVLAFSAHAESFWDGAAAVQRGDAAFEAGMFAASNAFARDTEIVIEDLATGRKTTARVIGRLDDRLDILVLLSPAAALSLGLEPGAIVHVRVTIKRIAAASEPILAEETALSTDPDRVPITVQREPTVAQAAAQAPAEKPAAEVVAEAPAEKPAVVAEAPAEKPAVEVIAEAPAEKPAAEVIAEAPAEKPAVEAPTESPAAEPGTSAEDAAFLAELAARSPQKQLFLPPREDEMFAYQEPVEPPAEAAAETVEVVEQPAETAPTAVKVAEASAPEIASDAGPSEPSAAPEPIALAEAQPPEEIRPELVESLAATAPEAEVEPVRSFAEPPALGAEAAAAAVAATPVAAAPAAVAPVAVAPVAVAPVAVAPVAKPAEAPKAAAPVQPAAVQTVLDLPGKGEFTWYLQLAAYASETLARDTAARLSTTYPVLVLAPQADGKALYRVFIGPLNRAESGTLLNYFRYRGFPDAFVRTARK